LRNTVSEDAIPDHHNQLRNPLRVSRDDGVVFTVDVTTNRRRASGHELVKATIRRGGAPLRQSDLEVQTPQVSVYIERRCRTDIRINSNGTYSGPGHICERSLRDAVIETVRFYCPEPSTGPKP
jgi:hypothetical protein